MKLTILALAALALGAAACNVFDPLDSPSGEAQLLSKGYACLDQGDAACATEAFAAVAPGNERVEAAEAFAILDGRSMGIREFISAFDLKNPSGGKALTNLANTLARAGQNTAATRQAFHEAFLKTQNITTQNQLRGMVRLVSAIGIAATTLAVDAGSDATFLPADLVDDPTNCNVGSCGAGGTCLSAGSGLTYGALTGDELLPTTAGALAGAPEVAWVYEAIKEMQLAVSSTELNVQGGIGNAINTFAGGVLSNATYGTNQGACFRFFLINFGIGT